jgi:hypothetical protein
VLAGPLTISVLFARVIFLRERKPFRSNPQFNPDPQEISALTARSKNTPRPRESARSTSIRSTSISSEGAPVCLASSTPKV